MGAFHEVMKSAIIFHVNLKGRIASWEAKCSMFSTRNKNDLNIFFPSPIRPCKRWAGNHSWQRVEQLHSGRRGAGAGGLATRSQPARLAEDRERSDRTKRTVITERHCRPLHEGKNKIAERRRREGRKGVRLEERLSLSPSLPSTLTRPEAPEVSSVLKPGLLQ